MTTTPFRWPGAKNRLMKPIMNLLHPMLESRNSFCEPFVGGGSVSLEVAKCYPSMLIYMADKDYGLYSFWKIVSQEDSSEFDALLEKLNIKPTIELFSQLREDKSNDMLMSAYKVLFFNRTTFSGIAMAGPIGGMRQQSKYTIDCRFNSKKLQDKLNNCRKLLKGRTLVSCASFKEYIPAQDNSVPMYIDPPYVKAGSQLYTHHMNDSEHKSLSDILKCKKNWVLSYDDHSLIRELYKDSKIIDTSAKYSIDGIKKTQKVMNELLIHST